MVTENKRNLHSANSVLVTKNDSVNSVNAAENDCTSFSDSAAKYWDIQAWANSVDPHEKLQNVTSDQRPALFKTHLQVREQGPVVQN